jgi:hypothetical protein
MCRGGTALGGLCDRNDAVNPVGSLERASWRPNVVRKMWYRHAAPMAYSRELQSAARRHQMAAHRLQEGERPHERRCHVAVAGYLYGIAAECALKEIMRQSGMRPLAVEERRDDPFYAHFPQLKTLLRDSACGTPVGGTAPVRE